MNTALKWVGIVAIVCIGGCIGIAVLGGVAVNNAAKNPGFQDAMKELGPSDDPARATLAEFNAIYNGMTYARVVQTVGGPGQLTSSSHIDGVPGVMAALDTEMYDWDGNAAMSGMNAIFQNGKLMQKSQFGLE